MIDSDVIASAGRVFRATNSLHSCVYFSPEGDEEYVAAGLRPGRMGYFASRSAPMGAVGPEVVTATFYNFNPAELRRGTSRGPGLWPPPHQVLAAARWQVADRTLRADLLGDEVIGSAELLAQAAANCQAGSAELRDRGSAAVRRPRRAGLAHRTAPGVLACGHPASRAPWRRAHRGAGAGRTVRNRGARDAYRHPPRVSGRRGQSAADVVRRGVGRGPGRPAGSGTARRGRRTHRGRAGTSGPARDRDQPALCRALARHRPQRGRRR